MVEIEVVNQDEYNNLETPNVRIGVGLACGGICVGGVCGVACVS